METQRDGQSRGGNKNTKFVGVRQRPSGKWVAEIKNTSQKIRMWLGTFDTAEEAARAYDEAACLLRGANTRTNFVNHQHLPLNSALSLKIRNLLNHKRSLKHIDLKSSATKDNVISIHSNTTSSSTTPATTGGLEKDVKFLEENAAYKPDLSDFSGGFEIGYHRFHPFSLGSMNAGLFNMGKMSSNSCDIGEVAGFERMKMERQISGSLNAMNGGDEYWQNVDDSTSAVDDAFWDIPLFYQTFYLS